jgi:hypothetical protein
MIMLPRGFLSPARDGKRKEKGEDGEELNKDTGSFALFHNNCKCIASFGSYKH